MTAPVAKRAFFVTGTDTGVGKSLVAVALTRGFVARGLRTAVMKPVAAGAIDTPDGPRNDDALALSGASNVAAAYDDVNPWLLATPASPNLAARADGVTIRPGKILRSYARLAAAADIVVIEGAGGWHAPISATQSMADIAQEMHDQMTLAGDPPVPVSLSVILVVGLRLGCLNHALLTREAIRSCSLPFAGWIANKMQTEMPLVDANIDTLASRFGMAPLAVIPTATPALSAAAPPWVSAALNSLVSP
jgi:dethiobiotin synthetase